MFNKTLRQSGRNANANKFAPHCRKIFISKQPRKCLEKIAFSQVSQIEKKKVSPYSTNADKIFDHPVPVNSAAKPNQLKANFLVKLISNTKSKLRGTNSRKLLFRSCPEINSKSIFLYGFGCFPRILYPGLRFVKLKNLHFTIVSFRGVIRTRIRGRKIKSVSDIDPAWSSSLDFPKEHKGNLSRRRKFSNRGGF